MINKQFDYDVSKINHKFNVGDTVYAVSNIDSIIRGDVPRISQGKITRLFLYWGKLKYDVQWHFLKSSEPESWLSPTEEDAPAIALKNALKKHQDKIAQYKDEIARINLALDKINKLLEQSK